MVCPGNHEIESDYYTGDNFVAYEARFAMPAVQQPKTSPSQEQMGCKHPYPTTPHSGDMRHVLPAMRHHVFLKLGSFETHCY